MVFLFLSTMVMAAGTIDSYPEGEKFHQAYLLEIRQNNLQPGVKGPLATKTLRYRDIWQGKKRTFLWTAQKFEDPDGDISYAVVLTQLLAGGKQQLLTAAGQTELDLAYSDELEPAYSIVYEGLNRHFKAARLQDKF